MNYKIGLAKSEDINKLIKKDGWANKYPQTSWFNKKNVKKIIDDNSKVCWTLKEHNEIIGCRLMLDDFEYRLYGWLHFIKEGYRDRGIMTYLFSETNKILKQRGYRVIYEECRIDNLASINWHKRLGFQSLGVLPKYYVNNSDALFFFYDLENMK